MAHPKRSIQNQNDSGSIKDAGISFDWFTVTIYKTKTAKDRTEIYL